MYKNKKILAVITARGGSKGVPKKNVKKLAGEPLIAYTIKSARNSMLLDYFLVSTDNLEIAKVSKRYKAPVPFMRPAELATDKAKSIPVVIHALDWLKQNKKQNYDYVMILQPTSPFRTSKDIDECIKKAVDTNADSVMSMMKLSDFSIPKLKKLDGDIILPFAEDEGKMSASKHELPNVYKRNCAIYLIKVSCIYNSDLFGKTSRAYIMPLERSVDINNMMDFIVADVMMKEVKKDRLKLAK